MHHLTVNTREFLIVDVGYKSECWIDYCDLCTGEQRIALPEYEGRNGTYSIIGRTDELSEDVLKGIVETVRFKNPNPMPKYIYKYGNDVEHYATAKESFASILKSRNLPHGLLIEKIK